ncbi:MAG: 3-hydroxyacyl-ACP dehydratase FabZ [Lachnospiraceae bacterium]|jgi:3-hydroxyacyl-[acyl-carrier-protein] dehydratase|nr:3-hydroxyacyl-ACP dehydratase FabZ [Lachnospiraceae bacterium]MCI6331105.1 3-hydroxyacyl-ACP dehydratase FabZ [Lachnospiraceae bacterium]MCI6666332.1 3-hydroxyacyl-ACP dehydratase FabZ [Lachnospiraceae bacterium]MCI6978231.1 3-hydroxyacyl-ACP dehydratase FabZ [Lachnospiraceae bacterium]MDD6579848.1 3-hydroxyacyl-ACP dehydratase FabZ [Lachnospiraceae bacterium]
MELSNKEIMEILPHRYPFLLVDKVVDYEPGKWAEGIKCVSANEMQFLGHFPNEPVMPGVLIIEALAQVGAIAVLTEEENKGKLVFFGGIKNARFKKKVVPGDVLTMKCELIARKGPIGFGKAVALVDGKVAASAELTFAIES